MNVHYKRDLNSNYMILTDEHREDGYEVRMITENRIYGFLPCVCQEHEQRTEYYYEITGRQSLQLAYERKKINCEQLKGFLRELLRILEAAGEYLLNPEHFILEPEYIYLHARTERLCLCYYPACKKDIRESFLNLAEYFLGKLDKSDAAGIEFGYDLYQRAMEPNFSLEELMKRTEKEGKCQPEAANIKENVLEQVSVQEEIPEKTGSWRSFFKKKPKKSKLEDYLAEADQIDSGAVLFLREKNSIGETTYLKTEKREGLLLKSRNPEYEDFHITGDSFLIGKKRDSVDGCIPAETISRIHARITKEGPSYYLEDLNSTNGTWADRIQLDPYELFPLENGMRITFASVEYEVEV